MEKPTEFDYLLNRMEHAGQQEKPADHHYGTHRASLLRHVRALEKDAERYRWLRDVASGGDWEHIGQTTNPTNTDARIDECMAAYRAVGDA